jgi:hypothetical protein
MDNAMERAMKDREAHTPEKGFNLVGIDDFEPFGEQLYTIRHFDNMEDAEAALKEWKDIETDDAVILEGKNQEKTAKY